MLSGLKTAQAKKFAETKLKELGMWNLRKKSPNSFSSGQKKKVLLAQALIHNPDIIIMDEPVANLDPKARIEFFELLMKLRKEGKSIFISSHVLAELDRYSDSLTVLDGGQIVYSGDKNALMKRFYHNHYICESDDNVAIIKYLNTHGIKHTLNTHENKITIYFKEPLQINKFQKFVAAKDIQLIMFEKIKPSLDEIYDHLVIKGSVDTMKE
jgi:ABC-2 type transport system ATP-binding protein